jgi:hypothetical protein
LTVIGPGQTVNGPAFIAGGYDANARNLGETPPYGKGQIAIIGNKIIGDTDSGRFNTGVLTNRFYNMVPQRDGSQGIVGNVINPPDIDHSSNRVWTQAGSTGSGTVNAPVTDRMGSSRGIRISSNNGSNSFQRLFSTVQNAAAGDIWICGGWIRTAIAPDVSPLDFTLTSFAGTSTFAGDSSNLSPANTTDGQWQWCWAWAQALTASGGATVVVNFVAQATASKAIDLDPTYFCCKIPAGTISAFDLGQILQNLACYVQAPLGVATTQPGQMLIAQGGLGVGNSIATSGHTFGGATNAIEIFDNFGNSLGWVQLQPKTS